MLKKIFLSILRIIKFQYKLKKMQLDFIIFKFIFFKKTMINQKFDKSTIYHIGGIKSFGRIKLAHEKEPLTQKWIHGMHSDSIFWDIGANLGIFTFLAAQRNLKVVAFEPFYANFHDLFRTLNNNKNLQEKIIILPMAMDKSFGINTFFSTNNKESGQSGGQFKNEFLSQEKKNKLIIKNKIISINEKYLNILLPDEYKSPQYIKIDVDGNDFRILQSLEQILMGDKIISLMIESNKLNKAKIINYISKFNMHLFDKEDTILGNSNEENLFFKKHSKT